MTYSSWTVVQTGLRWPPLLLQMMLSGSLLCLPSVESATGGKVQGELIRLPRTDPLYITCSPSPPPLFLCIAIHHLTLAIALS